MILRFLVLLPPQFTPLSDLFLPGILSQSLNLGFPDTLFLGPGGFPLVIVFVQHSQVLFLKLNEFINFIYSMSFSEEDKGSWHVYKLVEGRDPAPDPLTCLLPATATCGQGPWVRADRLPVLSTATVPAPCAQPTSWPSSYWCRISTPARAQQRTATPRSLSGQLSGQWEATRKVTWMASVESAGQAAGETGF